MTYEVDIRCASWSGESDKRNFVWPVANREIGARRSHDSWFRYIFLGYRVFFCYVCYRQTQPKFHIRLKCMLPQTFITHTCICATDMFWLHSALCLLRSLTPQKHPVILPVPSLFCFILTTPSTKVDQCWQGLLRISFLNGDTKGCVYIFVGSLTTMPPPSPTVLIDSGSHIAAVGT